MELVTLHIAMKLASKRGSFGGRIDRLFPEYPDQYKPRDRWLSLDEAERLLLALQPARRIAFLFMLLTGARRGELRRARWSDFSDDRVQLRGTKTERALRTVPLAPRLRDALAAAPRPANADALLVSDGWTNVNRDLKAACQQAGLAPVTPNDLRRTYASWLRNAAVDSSTVATLLGHTTTKMVDQVYGRLDFGAKARAVAAVDAFQRLSPPQVERRPTIEVEDRTNEPHDGSKHGSKQEITYEN